tara:strand:+ start:18063 stop:18284 length:222 start_codon:yes stop_codon:yes gene_type:complete
MRSARRYLDKVKMRPADPIARGVFTLTAIGISACTAPYYSLKIVFTLLKYLRGEWARSAQRGARTPYGLGSGR